MELFHNRYWPPQEKKHQLISAFISFAFYFRPVFWIFSIQNNNLSWINTRTGDPTFVSWWETKEKTNDFSLCLIQSFVATTATVLTAFTLLLISSNWTTSRFITLNARNDTKKCFFFVLHYVHTYINDSLTVVSIRFIQRIVNLVSLGN